MNATANETIASTQSVKLDGAPVTPTISGSSITISNSGFGNGPHVLEGLLVDTAGKRGHFRIAFTVATAPAIGVHVEKNVAPDATTTVTAVGGVASVTVPAGAYAPQAATRTATTGSSSGSTRSKPRHRRASASGRAASRSR